MNALMKHLESTSVIDPVKLSNGMMITFQSDDDADVVLDYARYTRLITTNNRYFTGDEIFDDSWDEKRAEIEANGGYVFPLYMIAHSGVALSLTPFSDPWDSGQVGWIYADKAMIEQEHGKITPEIFAEQMKLTYDLYEQDEVEREYELMKENNKIFNKNISGRANTYIINIFDII